MTTDARAADAYRDTTKWLVAAVPVTSVVAAGFVVGPDLARSITTTSSVGDWWQAHGVVLGCLVLVVVVVVAVLRSGARVLAAQPRLPVEQLAEGKGDIGRAIAAGAGLPYYLDTESFLRDLGDWTTAMDADDRPGADDPRPARLVPVLEAATDWSVLQRIRHRFHTFTGVLLVGGVVAAAALAVAAGRVPSGHTVDEATPVTVRLSDAGRTALTRDTGCAPDSATFTAVAGTWDAPVLVGDGPGCRFGARWTPAPDQAVVVPVPTPPP